MTTIPLPTRHQVAATSATLLCNTANTCIAMPFGFSIGEYLDNERPNYLCRLTQINPCRRLIATIGLFEDVGLAPRKPGDASTEFQEILSELEDLADILRVIETLDPSHTGPTQSDTIRSHGAVAFTHPEQLSLRDTKL
jgi:hypothetical protein